MKALIDADILPYEFGGMVELEDPEQPLPWEILRSMVDDRINQILEAVGATEHALYLTDSASNFRVGVATIKPYKGHRKAEKPPQWAAVRQHLIDNWNAEVQYGIEADDRLGIEQMSSYWLEFAKLELDNPFDSTVICSRDKDLHMIPGWHYVWPCGKQEERMWFQDETSAIRCFYKQLLTGDTSDNILGLYGVGSSSKLVKSIEEMEKEQLMFNLVFKAYEDRFGSYAFHFLRENSQLLWMLREEPVSTYAWPWEDGALLGGKEVTDRLTELLAHYEDEKEKEQTESTSGI